MSNIDRRRFRAVELLERRGYRWDGLEWMPPQRAPDCTREADAMYALLRRRADTLAGNPEGSAEERELSAIGEVLAAYEWKRWPTGKIAGGKG